jgi:enterochelin esterase-like enzyme
MKKAPSTALRLLTIGLIFCLVILIGLNWQSIFVNLQQKYFALTNHDTRQLQSRIQVVEIDSQVLKVKKTYKVYIPSAYEQAENKQFPVLYLLHGYPGTLDDWLINANLQHQLDELILDHKIEPLLVVMPDGNGPLVPDSQYVNAPAVAQPMADYVLEVVGDVDAHFRTLARREFRAVGGVSSGGYASVNLLFHYPETFSYAVSISGYFLNREWIARSLFKNHPDELHDNNPLEKVATIDLPKPSFIYLEFGAHDYAPFIDDNKKLAEKLTSRDIDFELHTNEGSHGWGSWKNTFSPPFEQLGEYWRVQSSLLLKPSSSPSPRSSFVPFQRKIRK